MNGQHCSFSVACDSEFKILAAIQTVDAVFRYRRHHLSEVGFVICSSGWKTKGVCRDLEPLIVLAAGCHHDMTRGLSSFSAGLSFNRLGLIVDKAVVLFAKTIR